MIPLPDATSRAVFIGKTGCGKTTLAYRVLGRYENAIVLDIKGEMTGRDWPGFTIFEDFEKLRKADPQITRRIWQPNIYEQTADHYEKFFKWIYERKNTAVYVDEVLAVCRNSHDIPFHYRAILTRGRQRKIACLQATQKPMNVPHEILSQSELFYVFYCKMPRDREKIEDITGIPAERQAALGNYQFFVGTDRDFSLKPYKLKL